MIGAAEGSFEQAVLVLVDRACEVAIEAVAGVIASSAFAAHVLVGEGDECHGRRGERERLLDAQFGIEHTTLQVDHTHPERLLDITPARGPEPAR